MKRGVQEVARSIAREDATRPIPTVGGRRQSKDEHPRVGVAETGQGSTPVRLRRRSGRPSRRRPVRATRRVAGRGDRRRSRQPTRPGPRESATRLPQWPRRDVALRKVVEVHGRSDLRDRLGSLVFARGPFRIATRPRRSRGSPRAVHVRRCRIGSRKAFEGGDESLLDLHVADPSSDVSVPSGRRPRPVGIERVVVGKHGIPFDVSWVGCAKPRWIGVHRHDLGANRPPRHRRG